jgi:NCS1 family nucleobase:cation symporter-1
MSGLVSRLRNGIPRPHLHAAGTEEVKGHDMWLDNDDIRYVIRKESIKLLLINL